MQEYYSLTLDNYSFRPLNVHEKYTDAASLINNHQFS